MYSVLNNINTLPQDTANVLNSKILLSCKKTYKTELHN